MIWTAWFHFTTRTMFPIFWILIWFSFGLVQFGLVWFGLVYDIYINSILIYVLKYESTQIVSS